NYATRHGGRWHCVAAAKTDRGAFALHRIYGGERGLVRQAVRTASLSFSGSSSKLRIHVGAPGVSGIPRWWVNESRGRWLETRPVRANQRNGKLYRRTVVQRSPRHRHSRYGALEAG